MSNIDLVHLMVSFLKGIPPQFLRYKVENTKTYRVLKDNYAVIRQDFIYEKLLQWIYIKFRGAFLVYPGLFAVLKNNQDDYIEQMFYLIVPSLWERFFNGGYDEDHLTEDMIMNAFFVEIKLPDVAKMRISYTNASSVQDIQYKYVNE